MNTVAEIEAAIEKLSASELHELMAWMDEYAALMSASVEIFKMYDAEESQSAQ